jgi:hypothetical protein
MLTLKLLLMIQQNHRGFDPRHRGSEVNLAGKDYRPP